MAIFLFFTGEKNKKESQFKKRVLQDFILLNGD